MNVWAAQIAESAAVCGYLVGCESLRDQRWH
jgi:hypothetical protein